MNEHRTVRVVCAGLAGLALLSMLAGCQRYHTGSLMHPQIATVAVGDFQNPTAEPRLDVQLKSRLVEQLGKSGSVVVRAVPDADAVLRGRILSTRIDAIASARTRDDAARTQDREAYQPTVFRATVVVEYELIMPGREQPVVAARQAVGTADFARLPDLDVARRQALRLALGDVAVKIAADVTEAW